LIELGGADRGETDGMGAIEVGGTVAVSEDGRGDSVEVPQLTKDRLATIQITATMRAAGITYVSDRVRELAGCVVPSEDVRAASLLLQELCRPRDTLRHGVRHSIVTGPGYGRR
jgi:hypothetical protein